MSWGDEWGGLWGEGGGPLDVVAKIKARLKTEYRDKPNLVAVAEWIGEQLQQVEDVIADVRAFTPLTQSFGKQLDLHGDGLGQLREGLSDGQLKAILIARYGALFRRRTPTLIMDILAALRSGTGTTTEYKEWYPAAFEVTFRNITAATAALWERIVRTAKLEGVRMTALVVEDNAKSFRYDTVGRGYDKGMQYAYSLETQGG